MDKELLYIKKRLWKARIQSIPFYIFRLCPIRKKKIVFCCIEGTTGYTCNPKYIAEEFIRRDEGYELVWLVNDMSKEFPEKIRKVRNTLWNRAYHLATAHFWIDNSRKQLEARKRKGQIYIQTWHAKLGFKPTCLDRGASFSRIAYLVSKHDSDITDYWLSNSKWYDRTLKTGSLYEGKVLRTGSPRCDILITDREDVRRRICERYHLPEGSRIIMYAPTFRGGSQRTSRTVETNQVFPDYGQLIRSLEKSFGDTWYIFLRLHPQLVARNLDRTVVVHTTATNSEATANEIDVFGRVIDVSRVDDMYEMLAGCDAFMTDYSSAAFDAALMKIPVFIYANDYGQYEKERGKLLWDLRKLPFPLALSNEDLEEQIKRFDQKKYIQKLERLFQETEMTEDGKAAAHVADKIEELT